MNTRLIDKNYFGRTGSPLDLEITGSDGSYLFDANDKEYIDFLGGWCVGNIGWGNKEIKDAIKRYNGPTYVHPTMLYRRWAELAEILADITPGKLKVSYRTTGGSESIEAAMQAAMCYTGRSKFLSIEDSYHGNTIGALSIGSSGNRKKYPNLLPGCYKIKLPLDVQALDKVESRLKKKDIAAFIMEPVICNLGVYIPEKEFMKGLQQLCNKYGTLLVMDEVATGFGRTGRLFATEHFDIAPDIITMAKAISGGYAGIGAMITTSKIARQIEDKFSFYSTYGWHPLSVEAAIANIKFLVRNKKPILDNVAEISELFQTRLSSMKFRHGSELSIKGLAIAVNVGASDYAKKIRKKCLNSGVLLNAEDDTLILFPALNIDRKVVENGLDILEACI